MKEKMISRGDLFYYDFGDRVGSVQSGERPVLVVQADDYNKNAPTVIVAAVTSVIKKRYLPSHIILGDKFGLKKPSMVLLEQVQTVNKNQSELPVPLCEQVLEFLTYEGEVVLDSFAGSGAVGEAALNLKRNCILIEILKDNIEKIKKRFENNVLMKTAMEW